MSQTTYRKAGAENSGTLQLVSFHLEHEEYGVEISNVQEIILLDDITRLPQTSPYIKGLINLRSTVIPIVDLRIRFGFDEQPPTDQTRIVVVNIHNKIIGVVVDAVNEVLRISRDEIRAAPPTTATAGQDYIVGLVHHNERMLIVLDIEKLIGDEESAEPEMALASA